MTPDEAQAMLRSVIHEVAPDADLEGLDPDAELRETLDLDSLDFLQVVELLSERTGRRIDEADYPQLRTLQQAAQWLASPVGTPGS